ncbi:MAG TPA: LytTR family DNA-binding domain-containing protein [Gemmatimonadaceae bacterium]|nr:LytTR family DNA-binding domain-containing protein [Gemmatimonadaceae bacterium]
MRAFRVVTIDDEPLARERISTLVRETDGLELLAEGRNGLEALDLITALEPDLVFIDVEMPELSGFGVVAALDDAHVPGVIFVTAYEHYALKAFEVGAFDYLHKPVTRQRFQAAVDRARERLDHRSAAERQKLIDGASRAERERGTRTRFVVRRTNAHHFVHVDQIDWIDAADNYLRLHTGDRTHLVRGTMKQAEQQLDSNHFVRVHRSAIVAVDRIVTINSHVSGGHVIVLKNGVRLKSSRQYLARVSAILAGL